MRKSLPFHRWPLPIPALFWLAGTLTVTHSLRAQAISSKEVSYEIRGTLTWKQNSGNGSVSLAGLAVEGLERSAGLSGEMAVGSASPRIEARIVDSEKGSQVVGRAYFQYVICGEDSVCTSRYIVRELPANTPIAVYVEPPASWTADDDLRLEHQQFKAQGWTGIVTLDRWQPVKEQADFTLENVSFPWP